MHRHPQRSLQTRARTPLSANNARLVELRGIRTPVYLDGVIDIQCRPFEILGKRVWLFLDLFERLWGLDIAVLLGRFLA